MRVEEKGWGRGWVMVAIILFFLFFGSGCSVNSITEGKNYEVAWQLSHLVDIGQTVQIGKNPHCHSEGNSMTQKLIGDHPSEGDVYKWGVGISILHYVGWKVIDKFGKNHGDIHVPLRALDTASKIQSVVSNHEHGLRVDGLSKKDQEKCDRIRDGFSTDITVWRF